MEHIALISGYRDCKHEVLQSCMGTWKLKRVKPLRIITRGGKPKYIHYSVHFLGLDTIALVCVSEPSATSHN